VQEAVGHEVDQACRGDQSEQEQKERWVALSKDPAPPSAVRTVGGVNGHRYRLLIDARPAELERHLVTPNLDPASCSTLSLGAKRSRRVPFACGRHAGPPGDRVR
jgi:hypothetical protein